LQDVVNEGELIAGKYRVEKVLGAGGMGVVVAALHLQLDERVAIKFLLPEMLNIPEAVQRFTREARAAVKIKSEHVARVFDVGLLESGAPYMVMEYLEGDDLAHWLERRGALPVELAVDFVLQACEALADAHALGIVHRDLKPANLFCTRRSDGTPSIKVLDFGISRTTGLGGSSDMGLTKTSAMMGSPRYMSPEQMQSPRGVDSRSDIWALGAILHELIAGSVPFAGETLPEICLKITTGEPPRLRSVRPGVPSGLESVVLKCLSKERDRRYRDVAALAAALAPFASERGRTSAQRIANVLSKTGLAHRQSVFAPAAVASSAGETAMTAAEAPLARTRVNRGRLVIAILACALAAAALTWSAKRRPPTGTASVAAPPRADPQAPPGVPVPVPTPVAPAPVPGHPAVAEPVPVPAVAPSPPKSGSHRNKAPHRAGKAALASPGPASAPPHAAVEPPKATQSPPARSTPPPDRSPPRGLIDDRR